MRRSTGAAFCASGAAAGAVATAALPAQAAQAADGIAWDHEVDVVVIGAGAGGLDLGHRGAREGRLGADRREEFRHRRARHDELRRASISAAATACRRRSGSRIRPIRCSRTGRGPRSRWAGSATGRWCAPMRTTISSCSIGWSSTGSSGRRTGRAPDRLDRSRTRLNVVPWPNEVTNPGRGSGFVRPLAKTARQMGVEILLQHQMTKIHRESPLAGRVIGITADGGRQLVPAEIPHREHPRPQGHRGGDRRQRRQSDLPHHVRRAADRGIPGREQRMDRAHRRRRDRRHGDRRGARGDRLPDHAGRQPDQQGPHGQEVQRLAPRRFIRPRRISSAPAPSASRSGTTRT